MAEASEAAAAARGGRKLIVAATFAATFLVSLDSAVITTAMPTVISQIGGISLYAWVFSAYLLASTVTVPIYGKLTDLYGRKPLFLFAVICFLGGSMACGFSQSMEQLIIFRIVQGVGAGGVFPITQTILGDIFSMAERARIQGVFSTVWGVSSLLGPAIGGSLTQYVTWRAVFFVNAPLCVLAFTLVALFLHEHVERRPHHIDYPGAVLLTLAISGVMFALQGGFALGGLELTALPLSILSALLLVAFVWQERRTPEPILPLELFQRRLIVVCTLGSVGGGMLLQAQNAFVPPFVQGIVGTTPTITGFVLAATSISWPLASTASGQALMRVGMRVPAVFGGAVLTLCFLSWTFVPASTNLWLPTVIEFVLGFGFGSFMPLTIIAVQNAVSWEQRGVATSMNLFGRNIGGSLGVAIAGAIFASGVSAAASTGADPNLLLSAVDRAQLAPDQVVLLQNILATSLHHVYLLLAAISAAVTVVAILMPGGVPDQSQPARAQEPSATRTPELSVAAG